MTHQPTRRRRLRLSLRAMLGIIVAVDIGLGWWVNGAREQQAAVAAIRAFDGNASIVYDDGFSFRGTTFHTVSSWLIA